MIVEKRDKNSGALLFKKDKESLDIEKAIKEIDSLKSIVSKLETRIKKLESKK